LKGEGPGALCFVAPYHPLLLLQDQMATI